MAARDVHDRVHLAGDAGVVHRHDHAGAIRDRSLDFGLVEVHGVGAHVDEDEARALRHERGRRGGERVARQDDLVARLEVAQDRRHLERARATRREQRLGAAGLSLEPFVAALGERAVAADLAVLGRLLDVAYFGPHVRGDVELDHACFFRFRGRGARKPRLPVSVLCRRSSRVTQTAFALWQRHLRVRADRRLPGSTPRAHSYDCLV